MTTETFPPEIAEIEETFEYLEEWDEKYDYIIELGKKLPPIAEEHRTKTNIVEGCMSTVWLIAERCSSDETKIQIIADSDSIIVKGLVVILLSALSGRTTSEIVEYDVEVLFAKFGMNQHLSPNRRNGLFSMVKRIRKLASEM